MCGDVSDSLCFETFPHSRIYFLSRVFSLVNQLAEAKQSSAEGAGSFLVKAPTHNFGLWHDVKTDPGSLIKSLNLNPRLKLAPSYTICLFYFTRHKEPRSHLSCPSQWFFHLQPLNCCWQPAKEVPISSFCLLPLWRGWCLCGQNSWKARLWGAMGKWAEKRNSFKQHQLKEFIQIAPIKLQPDASLHRLCNVGGQSRHKTHSHLRPVLMSPPVSPENNAVGTWTETWN